MDRRQQRLLRERLVRETEIFLERHLRRAKAPNWPIDRSVNEDAKENDGESENHSTGAPGVNARDRRRDAGSDYSP